MRVSFGIGKAFKIFGTLFFFRLLFGGSRKRRGRFRLW